MPDRGVTLTAGPDFGPDAVVLAYRVGDEIVPLAERTPPARGTVTRMPEWASGEGDTDTDQQT